MTSIRPILPALAIMVTAVIVAWFLMHNKPEMIRKPPPQAAQMVVETEQLQPRDYDVFIHSYGTVEPRTRVELKSQVSGQVIFVSDYFRAGGYFEKNDILIKIDPQDFESLVQVSSASLATAKQSLLEEQARGYQALQDWQRLGAGTEPSALVLRKPQLLAAEAQVTAAEAALNQSRLNLKRTIIRAPFTGRALSTQVNISQIVAAGNSLAEIFATDALEVRLPLRNQDLRFIDLPESYRFKTADAAKLPQVDIDSSLVVPERWSGQVVRTEGAIDESSQQLHVVARIDDPYGTEAEGRQPLKIGQYVTARIKGKHLTDVLVIPNRTIYQGTYVYVVEKGLLKRRAISVSWHNDEDAIIDSGLAAGDQLVLTALGQVSSGTAVNIVASDQPHHDAANRPAKNRTPAIMGETP